MLPARFKIAFHKNLTVANLIDEVCRIQGEDRVIFKFNEPLGHYGLHEDEITTGRFRKLVNAVSNAMASLGISQYDRVAVYKDNSFDYFLLSYAAMRLGAIAVPVNGGMRVGDLAYYLKQTGAKAICVDPASLERIRAELGEVPAPVEVTIVVDPEERETGQRDIVSLTPMLRDAPTDFTPVRMYRDTDVLICHTSGTTGFPKGVLHICDSLMRAAQGQLRIEPITARNLVMMAAPMNHHISVSGCLTTMAAAMPTYIWIDRDPDATLRTIDEEKVNIFFAFPDLYLRLYRAGLDRYDLSSMRMWMSGADAMHEVHIRAFTSKGAFLRLFGRPVVRSVFNELLGTSEVGVVALMKASHAGTKLYARCVGKPTPISPKVKVANEEGDPLPAGEVGRLMVKGPTLFKGYWNEHHKSHGVVLDGWWWTGDLAYKDRKGRFYQIDRAVDAAYTPRGPVYGLPLEEEVLKHPEVHEAVMLAVPKPGYGDVPAFVIQAKAGCDPDPEELRAWIDERTRPAHPIEKVVVVHKDEDIPRGLTGKVLKRVLRDRYVHLLAAPGAASPASETAEPESEAAVAV